MASVGVFGGYYSKKQLSDLKGWSGFIGVSHGLGVAKVSICDPFGLEITSKKISFSGLTASYGHGVNIPIPYYDLELGYTKIIYSRDWSKISSKESSQKILGYTIKMKKYNDYYRIYTLAFHKQFKFYKSSKKLKAVKV